MTKPTISEVLEKEHRDIDVDIIALCEGRADPKRLAQALGLLRRHIYMEEVILFPALASANQAYTMPISMMEIEHGYMWPMVDALLERIAEGRPIDDEDSRKQGQALFELLSLHNKREEDQLYTGADRLSDENGERTRLLESVSNFDMPAGWRCLLVSK